MNAESQATLPKLYRELAAWWPLLSTPGDYAEEADFFRRVLTDACSTPPRTVFELGCGGGNNACHLKAHFQMTLVDLSDGMLTVSRALNPDCEHLQGDMRSVRLERSFGAVFIHDAIAYMTTESDLRAAMRTAWLHCRPGGVALFAPDHVRETFQPTTDHGGHDDGLRGLRYLQWTWDPDPADSTYLADYAYLLREGQRVHCEQDRHVLGLFARADWLRLLREVGFEPSAIPCRHNPGPEGMEVFVGVRPGVQ